LSLSFFLCLFLCFFLLWHGPEPVPSSSHAQTLIRLMFPSHFIHVFELAITKGDPPNLYAIFTLAIPTTLTDHHSFLDLTVLTTGDLYKSLTSHYTGPCTNLYSRHSQINCRLYWYILLSAHN
jgi:hypothetical protein